MNMVRLIVGQGWEAIYGGRPVSCFLAQDRLSNLPLAISLVKDVIENFLRLGVHVDFLLISKNRCFSIAVLIA